VVAHIANCHIKEELLSPQNSLLLLRNHKGVAEPSMALSFGSLYPQQWLLLLVRIQLLDAAFKVVWW